MTATRFMEDWDALYAEDRHQSLWPWSDLVALVMRHARPPAVRAPLRILELGCGAGANLPFLRALGGEVWAIEASRTAIARLRAAHPDLAARLVEGDFTRAWPVPGSFDLIVDRGALTHTDCAGLGRALAEVRARLAPQGALISVDLFSTAFSEFDSGLPGATPCTRQGFTAGRLAGTGLAHFADRAHLDELFQGFVVEHLEHKSVRREHPAPAATFAAWNLVARRA